MRTVIQTQISGQKYPHNANTIKKFELEESIISWLWWWLSSFVESVVGLAESWHSGVGKLSYLPLSCVFCCSFEVVELVFSFCVESQCRSR